MWFEGLIFPLGALFMICYILWKVGALKFIMQGLERLK